MLACLLLSWTVRRRPKTTGKVEKSIAVRAGLPHEAFGGGWAGMGWQRVRLGWQRLRWPRSGVVCFLFRVCLFFVAFLFGLSLAGRCTGLAWAAWCRGWCAACALRFSCLFLFVAFCFGGGFSLTVRRQCCAELDGRLALSFFWLLRRHGHGGLLE